jgi:hypothetical protein
VLEHCDALDDALGEALALVAEDAAFEQVHPHACAGARPADSSSRPRTRAAHRRPRSSAIATDESEHF